MAIKYDLYFKLFYFHYILDTFYKLEVKRLYLLTFNTFKLNQKHH